MSSFEALFPELNACSFCPKLFLNYASLMKHKEEDHGLLPKQKLLEIKNLGVRPNLAIRVIDVGTRIMQECAVCGLSVQLSEYMEHQKMHIRQLEGKRGRRVFDESKLGQRSLPKTREPDLSVTNTESSSPTATTN